MFVYLSILDTGQVPIVHGAQCSLFEFTILDLQKFPLTVIRNG